MKTYIQIDVQNLFFSARDIRKRIDFKKIKDHFIETGDEIITLKAYIIRTPDAKSDKFESLLRSLGYNLNIKQALISTNSEGQRLYRGTDHDMAICIDCISDIDKYDKWVLMSGDGDFIDICKFLKRHGKFIEIWSLPGISFNKSFCDYANQIVFMNDKFFYEKEDYKNSNNKAYITPISSTP
jgi:uncharacterized LabA/DUF88 family protein